MSNILKNCIKLISNLKLFPNKVSGNDKLMCSYLYCIVISITMMALGTKLGY